MSGNVIFRGPVTTQPRTIQKKVAGPYAVGTFVEETATNLSQITTAVGKRPLLLGNADYAGQDIATAYTAGDTGVAYEVAAGEVYQAAMAAATYAKNAPLTISASGRLAAATVGTKVVAFFDDAPGAFTAGQLADVVIADTYIVPA